MRDLRWPAGRGTVIVRVVPAPGALLNLQDAVQLADALFDAAQSKAAGALRRIEADAVVGNGHGRLSARRLTETAMWDARAVANAVGQRLLHRAVDARAMLLRQVVEIAVDGQFHGHAKRRPKSRTCHSSAGCRPKSSSMLGRSPSARSRTVRTMLSTSCRHSATAPAIPLSVRAFVILAKSI